MDRAPVGSSGSQHLDGAPVGMILMLGPSQFGGSQSVCGSLIGVQGPNGSERLPVHLRGHNRSERIPVGLRDPSMVAEPQSG